MNSVKNSFSYLKPIYWLEFKRYAGHSKWANIRHTKAANDSARSKLFMGFSQRIKICIQEKGDGNPETNRALAQIIESAKRQSMPLTSIQNAIKVAQVDKTKCEECWYEIKGPKGCFMIVCAITNNRKRTKDNLATILKKNNGSFAENVIKMMFNRKAVIEAEPPENVKESDQVLEHAIECGAEDVEQAESNTYMFYSDPLHLEKVKKNLENFNYKIIEAENHFLPNSQVSLSDSELEAVEKLCNKLEDLPDVIKVYDNVA